MKISKKELTKRLGLFSFIKPSMIPMNATYLKMVVVDNVLALTGTDMRNTVIAKMDVISDDFAILVNYKLFNALLKSHGEEIEIVVEKYHVLMRSKGVKNKLTLIQDKYPNDPNFVAKSCLRMKSVRYVEGLKRAITSAMDTPVKPALGGVYVFGRKEDGKFITTIIGSDTKNTSVTKLESGDEDYEYMLGSNSIAILTKALKFDLKLHYNDDWVVAETELCTVYCRKFKEVYMNADHIFIDTPDVSVDVDYALFREYVGNCKVVDEENITIDVGDKLQLSAYSILGDADIKLDADITGRKIGIKVDVSKLLAGLNMVKDKKLYFEIGSNKKGMKSLVLYHGNFQYIMRAKR